ncbi:MAG TPA: hypothetical protein DEA08_00295 [Planctomycetes bacterium]|nr:hypothetical protein [Planctomycetota bacterium]
MLYYVELFYGLRFKLNQPDYSARLAIEFDGEHELIERAHQVGLDYVARDMAGYFEFKEGDMILVIGRRLGSAGLDLAPTFDTFRDEAIDAAREEVVAALAEAGIEGDPIFHLVSKHSY